MHLRNEFNDHLSDWEAPQLGLVNAKFGELVRETQAKIKEAYKAVYDKNRQISDLFNRNNELEALTKSLQAQTQDASANSKLIYEKNRQIGDLFNQNNELKVKLQDYEVSLAKTQEEVQSLK